MGYFRSVNNQEISTEREGEGEREGEREEMYTETWA